MNKEKFKFMRRRKRRFIKSLRSKNSEKHDFLFLGRRR